MGNINAPSITYFESFVAEIKGKFQRIKNLTDHTGTSGDYHEEIIRTTIRNFLTKRFSVKKGFIYKGPGEVSRQIDIMIIDETSPAAYLFQEGDFAIVLPDAVVAVIEVKTSLKATDFDKAVENIASVKSLYEYGTPRGIIFGYSGTEPKHSTMNSWFTRDVPSKYSSNQKLHPDIIFFFEYGCLFTRHEDDGSWNSYGKYYHRTFREGDEDDTAWQLSIILATILSACEESEMRMSHEFPKNIGSDLIQGRGSSISTERFALGEGMTHLALTATT